MIPLREACGPPHGTGVQCTLFVDVARQSGQRSALGPHDTHTIATAATWHRLSLKQCAVVHAGITGGGLPAAPAPFKVGEQNAPEVK